MKEEVLKEVILDEEECLYIEFLFFDFKSYENIMISILKENNKFNYNIETYNKYIEDYRKASMEYDLAISALFNKYAPEFIGKNVNVNITFSFRLAKFFKKGDCCEEGFNKINL
ncbi:hypothetical protein [Desnuesiella massiliensis]|uniref:hypothetical protein n=1 Tax=Desnuesiella massiliensis TaxID=1650662 RepID=UPI0006E292D9|nr:hypothetical protein [Desnuesiella massiliensis]